MIYFYLLFTVILCLIFFWCAPFGYLYFLIFYNEPELGVGIDPGMALSPLPSSNGKGLNPRHSDREPSALRLDHSFHLLLYFAYVHSNIKSTMCNLKKI